MAGIFLAPTHVGTIYSWLIPASQAAGSYQVIVYKTGDHTIFDKSDAFSITACPTSPTSPTTPPAAPGYPAIIVVLGLGIGIVAALGIVLKRRNQV